MVVRLGEQSHACGARTCTTKRQNGKAPKRQSDKAAKRRRGEAAKRQSGDKDTDICKQGKRYPLDAQAQGACDATECERMRFDSRRRTSLVDTSRTARRMLPDRSGRRPNPRCTGIWPAASTCGHIRSVCTLLPHPRRQMLSQRCERRPRQNDAHEIGLFEPHPGTCRHVQALTREMSASRVKQQASGKHTMPAARTVVRRCCCWATCGREGHVGADCELEAGAARGGGGAAGLLPAIIQGFRKQDDAA